MIRGVGIDVVDVGRVGRALERHGDRFVHRVFRPSEVGSPASPRSLAARFAAKEAVFKALGTGLSGGLRWTDVEVVVRPGGAPAIRLHGRAREAALALGVTRTHLSLTHDGGVAAAVVILEGDEP